MPGRWGTSSTMLRIARGQYASPNGMRLGFDRFWVLLRCTLLKGLILGGVAMASMYVAIAIYMMTPLSNSAVDILMPLVKNAGTSGILLDDATYAQLMDAIDACDGAVSACCSSPLPRQYFTGTAWRIISSSTAPPPARWQLCGTAG